MGHKYDKPVAGWIRFQSTSDDLHPLEAEDSILAAAEAAGVDAALVGEDGLPEYFDVLVLANGNEDVELFREEMMVRYAEPVEFLVLSPGMGPDVPEIRHRLAEAREAFEEGATA